MAEPSPTPAVAAQPAGFLGRLRARLKARPDTEHEQGVLRLVIGALLVAYLLPGTSDPEQRALILYVGAGQFVIGVLFFLRIAYTTHISPSRRIFAQLADVGTITIYMAMCGEWAAPLFLIYIWVALGQGFRYGPRYLLVSLALSVVGFAAVLAISDFWRQYLGADAAAA